MKDDSSWEIQLGQMAAFAVASDLPEFPGLMTTLVFGLVILFIGHYLTNVVQKPEFISSQSPFGAFLTQKCPVFSQKYWPSIWCFNVHVMTPASYILRGLLPAIKYHREYVRTPDGGQFSLDWYDPTGDGHDCTMDSTCNSAVHQNPSQPIAIFFPGLTGCSQADYFRSLVPLAHRVGYRAIAVNYRGMGGTKLLTPRFYCGTTDDDIHEAVNYIKQQNPNAKIIAIGTSLGGILLGRYLISSGASSQVDAAFLASVCYNYQEIADTMESDFLNAKLNYFLTQNLISTVLEHREWFENNAQYDLKHICSTTTMRDFDAAFLIKMFGYKDTEEYYLEAAHKGKMERIKTPTLCLNAGDDILSPLKYLPIDEIKANPNLAMLVTGRGGHIGFMENSIPYLMKRTFFSERVLEEYLRALLDCEDIKKKFVVN